MEKHFEDSSEEENLRKKIIGLGEKSIRKSYYPELQEKLFDLERYRFLLEQISEGIIVIETTTCIIMDISRTAAKFFNSSVFDLIGKTILDISEKFYEVIFPEILNTIKGIPDSGKTEIIHLNDKNQNELSIEVSLKSAEFDEKLYTIIILRDITEKTRAERIIKRFKFIVDNAGEEFYLADLKGKFIYVNEAAAKNLGYTIEELMNLSVAQIDTFYNSERIKDLFERANSNELPLIETFHISKVGKKIPKEIKAVRLDFDDQQYICAFARDISFRKKIEENLILAKEQAERSDRLKTEFLAQMSHEIRTPINTILSFSSLVREELENKLDEDLNTSFESIEIGGRRLIRTIDLILDMSQVQTGNIDITPVELDLEKDVLEDIILNLAPLAKKKNILLSMENKNVHEKIRADRYSISQVFVNLIDNAIKYTLKGEVKIKLYIINNKIFVDVKDTGIGISQEYLNIIFTPFSQEDTGYTRRFEGTGLGLALVKKYCEMNDVEIKVQSKKGEGSVFTVAFKIDE